jgi:hypothetical protein
VRSSSFICPSPCTWLTQFSDTRMLFSHPPHPSEALLKHLNHPKSKQLQETSSLFPKSPLDPHQLPAFDSKSLTEPEEPVLYPPPLLPSLPEAFLHPPVSAEYPPVLTETRIPHIDPASLSLHKALHHFRPLNANYATVPYGEAFNWAELELPEHEEREWYCVAFRSKREVGSDGSCSSFPLLPALLQTYFV